MKTSKALLPLALWPSTHATTPQSSKPTSEVPDWLKNYDFDPPLTCRSSPAGPLSPSNEALTCPPLVDDETALEKRSWRPWTYPPVCVEPEEEATQDAQQQQQRLCVFTHARFRGEAGLSVITTPEAAAAGVGGGVLEDRDPVWEGWARDHHHHHQHPLVVVATPPPYEIRELEGKGLGVVANRTIGKGEVVLRQHPVLLRILDPRRWKHADVMRLLHRAVVQLPLREGRQVMELARAKGGYVVDDIVNTNAFGVLLGGIEHSGLYLEVSVSYLPTYLPKDSFGL